MRRALPAHVGLAVLLAFFGAPFLHVHTAAGHDSHHDGRPASQHGAIVHTHFPGAVTTEHEDADVSQSEEHELALNVFAAVLSLPALSDVPFLTAERIEARPPVGSVAQIILQFAPRTHDPPLLETANPRAPPV